MTVYLESTRGTRTGRYQVQAKTAAGQLVGQAVDPDEGEARRRVLRQARAWAKDHGWGTLTIVRRPA